MNDKLIVAIIAVDHQARRQAAPALQRNEWYDRRSRSGRNRPHGERAAPTISRLRDGRYSTDSSHHRADSLWILWCANQPSSVISFLNMAPVVSSGRYSV